jgi:hypothetical protein
MKLAGNQDSPWPKVSIEPTPAARIVTGPVRVFSRRESYWDVVARKSGYYRVIFQMDNQKIEKELAIGDGFMRVSAKRPGWNWNDILIYPREKPFGPDSIVQSISIEYHKRISYTSGADWWIGYFFYCFSCFCFDIQTGFKGQDISLTGYGKMSPLEMTSY